MSRAVAEVAILAPPVDLHRGHVSTSGNSRFSGVRFPVRREVRHKPRGSRLTDPALGCQGARRLSIRLRNCGQASTAVLRTYGGDTFGRERRGC